MGKRIVLILEILVVFTLFSLFGALVITSQTNDAIIEHTEDFVETVRYKGCITDDMYYEFINGFHSPIDVSFVITKKPLLISSDPTLPSETIEFTNNVINALENPIETERIYKMNIGDEIQVIVRKPSGNFYDSLIEMITGQRSGINQPVVAIKGGMILNTQYKD